MRKIFVIAIFVYSACVPNAFAQAMVNVKTFATYYGFKNGNIDVDNEYTWDLEEEDNKFWGSYEGNFRNVDTAKEWFLVMAYGKVQIKVNDPSIGSKNRGCLAT
jgi:hypothetical protein